MNQRLRLTESIAVRVYKQRTRCRVYTDRATATGNPALAYVASLESEILRDVDQEWSVMLGFWALRDRSERVVLATILVRAKAIARQKVCTMYDHRETIGDLVSGVDMMSPYDLFQR